MSIEKKTGPGVYKIAPTPMTFKGNMWCINYPFDPLRLTTFVNTLPEKLVFSRLNTGLYQLKTENELELFVEDKTFILVSTGYNSEASILNAWCNPSDPSQIYIVTRQYGSNLFADSLLHNCSIEITVYP